MGNPDAALPLSEIYRLNPGISLYVGLFAKPTGGTYTFSEVKSLQNYAGGSLRQVAVWCGHKELDAGDLTALQGIATYLQEYDRPLSIGYAPKVASVTSLPSSLAGAGKCNVSVIIGQAGKGVGAQLYADKGNTGKASVSGLGVWLGITSKAAVHQSIASVEKFPTGIDLPAFGDGTLLRDLDTAIVENSTSRVTCFRDLRRLCRFVFQRFAHNGRCGERLRLYRERPYYGQGGSRHP